MPAQSKLDRYYFNNRIVHGTLANLPADASSGWGPGALYINSETGHIYRNLGTSSHALFRCKGVNWFELESQFDLRPGINANRDVPAGDTYNTAQMQLGVDRSPHFEALGVNAVSADVTSLTGGGIAVASHGAATDSTIIAPHLNSNVSAWTTAAWNTDRELRFEVRLETDALIADETIWAGFKLTNTSVIATDNDQTFFRFKDDAGSGVWQVTDSNNGTDTTASSGVTVAISSIYVLTIQVDSTKVPRYYVNGVLKATGVALKANATLIPYVGVLSDTSATAKVINVRSILCGQSYA